MYKMIDLFAGIGGIRLGFESALEAKTVFVSEIDNFARKTYAQNFPDATIDGDITQIPAENIPPFDICLAGFPCQAFSIAGHRQGFDDDYHGICRGTLFLHVVRICDFHKPKIIFCENVKGLLNHDRGRTFKIICNAFEQIGYKIFHKVLNSRDFGVPQNRERIYIVCFRNDIAPEKFFFPAPTDEIFSIRDILQYPPVPAKYYLSDVYLQTLRRHKERHQSKGHGFGFEIKNLDGVANALVCGGMGRERNLIVDERPHSTKPTTNIRGHINSENVRKLTPRECARLQGFPDDFKLILPDTHLYKQFGNTVSIDVVAAIAREIRSVLEPMNFNKGEWSELYALLKILADGKVVAQNQTLPVLKICRRDVNGFMLDFRRDKNFVHIFQNGDFIKKIPTENFAGMADKILCGIRLGKGSFEIDGADKILLDLGLTKIKSPADKKSDIELEIHDTFTTTVRGYSIKSDLGKPPTLLNASRATNFRFKVFGADTSLNEIENLGERLKKIPRLEFDSVVNKIFADNLSLVDSRMDKILAEMLLLFYVEKISACSELATILEEKNSLDAADNFYRHKIKKFLIAVALGLMPAKKWSGTDQAQGGYLIVKRSGELELFPLTGRDDFETYLLNNTRLECPSQNRHNFGIIHAGGGVTSTSTCKFVSNKNQSPIKRRGFFIRVCW